MGRLDTLRISSLVCILVACGATGSAGCGSETADPGGEATAATTPPTAEAPPEPPREPVPVEEPGQDIAGLRGVVHDDGTITLSGTDRWGERFETTYADVDFFEGSVPVWKRSVTDAQGEALDAFLAELKAGTPGDTQEAEEAEETEEAAE